jgi:hypothetical protein
MCRLAKDCTQTVKIIQIPDQIYELFGAILGAIMTPRATITSTAREAPMSE